MKMKIGIVVVALTSMFIANASVSTARADEAPSIVPLTTTIGDGQSPFDFSGSTGVSQVGPSVSTLSFSPSSIPEPSTIGFLIVGIALLGVTKSRKQKHS
jgi:hypothetical protein